jgi:hypothetical protein
MRCCRRHPKGESVERLAHRIKEPCSLAVAEVYGFRGQCDQAVEWLEQARAPQEPDMQHVNYDPALKNLDGYPRYQALVRKMNLPD